MVEVSQAVRALRSLVPVRYLAEARSTGTLPTWLVGGGVRDALLGRDVVDVDVVVAGSARTVARSLARGVDAHVFQLSDRYGGWRVIAKDRGWQTDVVECRAETIEGDLLLRDFTANALAMPLESLESVVDPTGGLADIAAGVLRVVGPAAFRDDPVRTMRLPRQASELGFAIDSSTGEMARAAAPDLVASAGERAFSEFRALISSDAPVRGIELMTDLGVTAVVLPEIHPVGKETEYESVVERLQRLTELESNRFADLGALGAEIASALDAPVGDSLTRGLALRIAALLRGTGTTDERTNGADDVVGRICRRFATSRGLETFLRNLMEVRIDIGFVASDVPIGPRDVFRWLRRSEPVALEAVVLWMAENPDWREPGDGSLAGVRMLVEAALKWRSAGPVKPLVDGREVLEESGLKPGPRIGRLLEEIVEAQYVGEVRSRQEAVEFVRRRVSELQSQAD